MMETRSSERKIAAISLVILSLTACGLLMAQCYRLRGEAGSAKEALAQSRNRAALTTLDSFSLPLNRKMAVCNETGTGVTISALTAFYIDDDGSLRNYNSASNKWHTWRIAAGSHQMLDDTGQGGTAWNGSALFYAMDLGGPGESALLSGTSEDLSRGCIALRAR